MNRLCYGVCYLALAVGLGAFGYGCFSVVRAVIPESFYRAEPYANNLNDTEANRPRFAAVYGTNRQTGGIALPPEETISRLREEAKASAIASQRGDAIGHATTSLIVLLVAGAAFAVHWHLARRWGVVSVPGPDPEQSAGEAGRLAQERGITQRS